MSAFRFAILSALFLPGLALAGPNAGGSLVLHIAQSITTSYTNYCGSADLDRCDEAVVHAPGNEQFVVIFVLAVFPNYVSPRLSGVTFGIDYNLSGFAHHGGCANLEVQSETWPDPGSGIGIVWTPPKEDRITEVYWFATYAYPGTYFAVEGHPLHGGTFDDDDVEIALDTIEDYGRIGFGEEQGYNPCLAGLPKGACCDPDANCSIQIEQTCESFGGTYLGDDTECRFDTCRGPCCMGNDCFAMTEDECFREGGVWKGVGRTCERTACIPTNASWGVIKQTFR